MSKLITGLLMLITTVFCIEDVIDINTFIICIYISVSLMAFGIDEIRSKY